MMLPNWQHNPRMVKPKCNALNQKYVQNGSCSWLSALAASLPEIQDGAFIHLALLCAQDKMK